MGFFFRQCYMCEWNGPLRKTKRSGTYEMPVRLYQTFLLQSFVLHASNNMGIKCTPVILLVPFSAMCLCSCQKCFERNYNSWKLVSSSGVYSSIYGIRSLWGTINAESLGTDENLTFISLDSPQLPLCLYVNISSNVFVLLFLCLCNPFQKDHYNHYSALLPAVWHGRYNTTQKSPFHNIHWKFRNCVIRWV